VSRQRGAATPIIAGLLVLAVLLSLLVVDVARVAAARTQLTTAADAAALAAAPATFADFGAGTNPQRAAAETARTNGARLVDCRCPIDPTWATRTVQVVVACDVGLTLLGSRHLEAVAGAEFSPVRLAGGEVRAVADR
jgi:uncharacterized membrane protein